MATAPNINNGRYHENRAEAAINKPGERTGVAEYALDPEPAERPWTLSDDAVGQLIRADRDPRAVAGHGR